MIELFRISKFIIIANRSVSANYITTKPYTQKMDTVSKFHFIELYETF